VQANIEALEGKRLFILILLLSLFIYAIMDSMIVELSKGWKPEFWKGSVRGEIH
jgi:hypothetical protein